MKFNNNLKFCNHCGRLYKTKCVCQREKKKENHNNFYSTSYWRQVSDSIKIRDFKLDRLQLFMQRPELASISIRNTKTYNLLHDYLIDVYGNARRFSGSLVVHHIIPIEDDYELRYTTDNLITLNYHTHEYVHQLYKQNKDEVQNILVEAVEANLP